MELRLYKLPYREPHRPDVTRLLFEGTAADNEGFGEEMDFYIYTWIRDEKNLESFQAVLADAITLIYRSPNYISFGKIGHFPFNRTVQTTESDEERKLMENTVKNMSDKHFPNLIKSIKQIVGGEKRGDITLNDKESQYLEVLMKKNRI